MSNLGSLVVSLEANIVKYQSDLGKAAAIAEQRMQQIDKSIGFVKNSLAVLGVGFLANATFDKIKGKIESVIESAARLQQLSERTGAAVEALSGLSSVAKLSGTDTDSLAIGLQKLSKSMVDAENGGKKTGASFAAIGISAKDLKNSSPEDTFLKIAKQLDNYQDGAGKTVIMQNLLGKAGANLLPVMKDLAIVGEYQTKTTAAQAEAADAYEKDLVRLQIANDALYKTIGLALVPVLSDLTGAMLDTIKSSNGVKKSINDLAKDGTIRDWAENAVIAGATIIETFVMIGKAAYALGGSFQAVYADLTVAGTLVKNGGLVGLAFESNRKELSKALDARNKVVEDANKRYVDLWNYDATALTKNLRSRFDLAKDPELQMWNAMSGDGGKKQKINTSGLGNKNPYTGPKDDPAKKLMEGQLKDQESFIAAEKTQLQTREQYLQYYYQQEYTNASDYYGSKTALIQDALKNQLAAYDAETAAVNVYLSQKRKDVDVQGANNKLREISANRRAAEIEANKQLTDTILEQAKAYRDFDLATTAVARQHQLDNAQAQFQIDMLGRGTLEVVKATEARRLQLALEQRLYDMRNKNLPQAEMDRAIAETEEQKARAMTLIEASYRKQIDGWFGAGEAMRKYGEDAANVGLQVENAMTNAFHGMEDALVQFVMTGKLSFKSLADSIVADITRIIIKQEIASAIGGSGGGGWLTSLVGAGIKSFGGTDAVATVASALPGDALDNFVSLSGAFANGGTVLGDNSYLVGEKGPEIFTPNSSGTIIPNDKIGGGSAQPIIVNNNFTINGQTDRRTQQQIAAQAAAGAQRAMARNL